MLRQLTRQLSSRKLSSSSSSSSPIQTLCKMSTTSHETNHQHQLDLGPQHQLSDKKALRKQIKQLLSTLSAEEVESQSVDATKLLFSMSEYRDANSISVFMSMPGGEINTSLLLTDALKSGKKVFIPYIYKLPAEHQKEGQPVSVMDMLLLSSAEDRQSLKPDRWGIPSIPKESVESRENCFGGTGLSYGASPQDDAAGLDLVVMPSMAFDGDMNRLGHGKGYYDYFLTRYCGGDKGGRKKPCLIGLALAEQMIPSPYRLPTESWDWRVDGIMVGNGIMHVGKDMALSSGGRPE